MKGKLIVIEGTDCSGKETQTRMLVDKLSKQNIEISNMSDYKVTNIFDAIKLIEAVSYYIILDLLIEKQKIGGINRWIY